MLRSLAVLRSLRTLPACPPSLSTFCGFGYRELARFACGMTLALTSDLSARAHWQSQSIQIDFQAEQHGNILLDSIFGVASPKTYGWGAKCSASWTSERSSCDKITAQASNRSTNRTLSQVPRHLVGDSKSIPCKSYQSDTTMYPKPCSVYYDPYIKP